MRGSRVAVCSNCGGSDFVWAENVKTGGLGRGGLSLRSGGELAIGTRVCRGCGHADLFVKDPTVLRQPHTWRPGEFVPIPPRSGGPGRPSTSGPTSSGPGPSAGPAPSGSPVPMTPPVPPNPAPSAAPGPSTSSAPSPGPAEGPVPTATPEPASPDVPPGEPAEAGAKKPARRRSSKPKATNPPVIHE